MVVPEPDGAVDELSTTYWNTVEPIDDHEIVAEVSVIPDTARLVTVSHGVVNGTVTHAEKPPPGQLLRTCA